MKGLGLALVENAESCARKQGRISLRTVSGSHCPEADRMLLATSNLINCEL